MSLSLLGISVTAFVMMSCKPPPTVPWRPAMGKDMLHADTSHRVAGTRPSQETRLVLLQPRADGFALLPS
eukprot:scaffold24914_cov70-Phaeocystis_antarctica.AAC.3